jgi:hypothetical protein
MQIPVTNLLTMDIDRVKGAGLESRCFGAAKAYEKTNYVRLLLE